MQPVYLLLEIHPLAVKISLPDLLLSYRDLVSFRLEFVS